MRNRPFEPAEGELQFDQDLREPQKRLWKLDRRLDELISDVSKLERSVREGSSTLSSPWYTPGRVARKPA